MTDEPYAPLPTVAGGFSTVLSDPPWRFQNRTGKVAPEHKRLGRYGTMPLDAIKDLPVADVAASNAHLYLWVPNALLPEGLSSADVSRCRIFYLQGSGRKSVDHRYSQYRANCARMLFMT